MAPLALAMGAAPALGAAPAMGAAPAFGSGAAIVAAPLQGEAQVPPNDGWITDLADFVSAPKEAELEELMESYRNGEGGHEIAVLTVPSLKGRSIEDFALTVAREWGIGRAEISNGALLVIAAAERKTRIEVGRGLEGNIPDAIAGRILRDVLRPQMRAGNFEGGIEAAVRALHAAAGGDYGPLDRAEGEPSGTTGDIVMFTVMALFMLTIFHRRRHDPRNMTGGRGGFGPVIIGGPSRGFGGGFGGSSGGGGFGGFGGGGGFSGGGASGGW